MKFQFSFRLLLLLVSFCFLILWLLPKPALQLTLPSKVICWVELNSFNHKRGVICLSISGSLLHVEKRFEVIECNNPRYLLHLDQDRGIATLSCETKLVAVIGLSSNEISVSQFENVSLWTLGLESIGDMVSETDIER
jgi:hypothetical protein